MICVNSRRYRDAKRRPMAEMPVPLGCSRLMTRRCRQPPGSATPSRRIVTHSQGHESVERCTRWFATLRRKRATDPKKRKVAVVVGIGRRHPDCLSLSRSTPRTSYSYSSSYSKSSPRRRPLSNPVKASFESESEAAKRRRKGRRALGVAAGGSFHVGSFRGVGVPADRCPV